MTTPGSGRLRDPNEGDPISAEQARIQNELLRRFVKLPNSITDSSGTRMVARRAGGGGVGGVLYWCMLMEDHPGRGKCFDLIIGQWCSSEHKYRFDCATDPSEYETGIDWYFGVPYPKKYAQGWFQRETSDWTTSGYIYVAVGLDCTSDDVCDPTHNLPCDPPATDPCEPVV